MPDINLILLTLRVFAIVSILTSYIFSYSYIHLISYNNEYHNSPFTASDCTISFVTCPDLEGGLSKTYPHQVVEIPAGRPSRMRVNPRAAGGGGHKVAPLTFCRIYPKSDDLRTWNLAIASNEHLGNVCWKMVVAPEMTPQWRHKVLSFSVMERFEIRRVACHNVYSHDSP